MRPSRLPPIVIAIIVMTIVSVGLGIYLKTGPTAFHGGAGLVVGLGRMFLNGLIVICIVAAAITFFRNRHVAMNETPRGHAGPIVAVLLAIVAVLLAAVGLGSALPGSGGSGEWAGLGDVLILIMAVPCAGAALVMGIFLKTFGRFGRISCIVLSLLAAGLMMATPGVRKARDRERVRQLESEVRRVER